MRATLFGLVLGILTTLAAGCGSPETSSPASATPHLPEVEGSSPVPAPRPPVLFVHGINGSSADFDALRQRMLAGGWEADRLFAIDFADPAWGCNVDNASQIGARVDEILAETGEPALQIVAHSMGSLSSRYFLKNLEGTAQVTTAVTLGGMNRGLASPCSPDFPGKPCVWTELCETGAFIAGLNSEPAAPGDLQWASIYGTADTTVPNSSSPIEGAENIPVPDVDHMGLLDDSVVFEHLRRVLGYPAELEQHGGAMKRLRPR